MNHRSWSGPRKTATRYPGKLNGPARNGKHSASALFDAPPMVHPQVLDAYEQAIRALKTARVHFRVTGGIALNLYGAGRPTKDVDLIVPRTDWLKAIRAVEQIATEKPGIRFGLPDEPDNGLAVIGPHGVPIEVWPEGTTHEQIARIRGKQKTRTHPAGKLAFTLKGDATVSLINDKLASYLTARDRLRDAADVQTLIKCLELPLTFANRLAPQVRPAYRRLWVG